METECPEELKDIGAAALTIASLKRTKLDNEIAASLDQIKTNIRMHPTIPPSQFKDLVPLIPRLHGLIGKCSQTFEKKLIPTDVNPSQSRLAMHTADVERCLLPLLTNEENVYKGIKVSAYDNGGNEYKMIFKVWAEKIYVLKTGWKEFYIDHNLLGNQDVVIIWMFRNVMTGKLCFVISSRRFPIH